MRIGNLLNGQFQTQITLPMIKNHDFSPLFTF
jgi:hypothetical protein